MWLCGNKKGGFGVGIMVEVLRWGSWGKVELRLSKVDFYNVEVVMMSV